MSVDYQRKDYEKALPDWEMVSDVCQGERAVKDRDRISITPNQIQVTHAQKRYLPMPNPGDLSTENLLRYQQYLQRAVFTNYTGYTGAGLLGMAFKRNPEYDLAGMDYLLENANGKGEGLFQHMQNATAAVLKTGRYGLWVDYPKTNGGASRADMESGAVRANIIAFQPEQIINWRTDVDGAISKLSLVVIREFVEEISDDGFSADEVEQFRVLRLGRYRYAEQADNTVRIDTASLVYSVEIYRKTSEGIEMIEAATPVDGAGSPWDEIPFTFIGAQDNNPGIDKAPLYDMAVVNLAHYRNSADEEDAGFFMGQVQPVISGLDEQWRDWLQENEIYVGSRNPVLLPENGSMSLLQSSENTMIERMKADKQQAIVAIGARLIQPGQAVKTATEAQGDRETEHSVMSLVVENVSEAYTSAVAWCARYMNITGDVFVSINREFVEMRPDSQMIAAIVAAWQSGALPRSDVFDFMRRSGIIDNEKSDEEISEELESEPVGLGLDDNPQ